MGKNGEEHNRPAPNKAIYVNKKEIYGKDNELTWRQILKYADLDVDNYHLFFVKYKNSELKQDDQPCVVVRMTISECLWGDATTLTRRRLAFKSIEEDKRIYMYSNQKVDPNNVRKDIRSTSQPIPADPNGKSHILDSPTQIDPLVRRAPLGWECPKCPSAWEIQTRKNSIP